MGPCPAYSRKKTQRQKKIVQCYSKNYYPGTLAKKLGGGAGRGRVWGGGAGGEREEGHIQHINKALEINLEKCTYIKTADLHCFFYGTTLSLLLLTLPRGRFPLNLKIQLNNVFQTSWQEKVMIIIFKAELSQGRFPGDVTVGFAWCFPWVLGRALTGMENRGASLKHFIKYMYVIILLRSILEYNSCII